MGKPVFDIPLADLAATAKKYRSQLLAYLDREAEKLQEYEKRLKQTRERKRRNRRRRSIRHKRKSKS